ncbi:hypothetical protein [Carnobacterium maltaromaticum]|uniref:hypothetical protein n=1 Tax=Carnobacterium maltaromaticum TaxID=2751 RepID=UPI0018CED78B|nr:hypothetical protein [Carnobacterium maltaromaticum]
MNELVDVVIGVSIGILVIKSAHLSENEKQCKDDGDKIISGGMIYGTKSKNDKNKI